MVFRIFRFGSLDYGHELKVARRVWAMAIQQGIHSTGAQIKNTGYFLFEDSGMT